MQIGDEVTVRDLGACLRTEHPGRVVKVGRKLVTITWNGRTRQFRLIDRRVHDYEGNFEFTAVDTGLLSNRRGDGQ